MNLTIDIGNTCTKLVAFDGTTPVEELRMESGEYFKLNDFCNKYHFAQGIFSSVIDLSDDFKRSIDGLSFPVMQLVSGETPLPITNKYSTPSTLGADRLAAAVGAFYKGRGHDLLVIDVGTCITYEFITASGEYMGGNISPGPTIRLKALNQFTDSLPLIERKGNTPTFGNDTETAIRSGVMRGIECEIEGYVNDFSSNHPDSLIYLTGGVNLDSRVLKGKGVIIDKCIVPEGLNHILIYNKNFHSNEKNNIK